MFVVYNRRREAHIKYPGPDDDVRENIINYDDEGGGEDDMTAFDITPLQIPIGPMPELSQCKMPIMCKYSFLNSKFMYYATDRRQPKSTFYVVRIVSRSH